MQAYSPQRDTISIALVQEALTHAYSQGLDVTQLLKQAELDIECLKHPQNRISTESFAQLWIHLADAMNDEFFGLDQHPMRRGSYKLISKLIYTRQNFQSALLDILNALNLILDDFQGHLEMDESYAKIIIRDGDTPKSMFAYATYLMLIHTLLCWLVDQRVLIEKIEVRCPQPNYDLDYRIRFSPEIHYECSENCIYFDLSYLSLKIKKTSQDWYTFIKNTPENLLVRFKNPSSLSYQIRYDLKNSAPEYWPELSYFAVQFNMSDATLQRRLKNEGTHYQQLKNEIRRDLAMQCLSLNDHSLEMISTTLGFHDVSAFSRAFKKWTGQTPGNYRQKQHLSSNIKSFK